MQRRGLMLGAAAILADAAMPRMARAQAATLGGDLQVPTTSRDAFIEWAVRHRREDREMLGARWDRYVVLRQRKDFARPREGHAFLLTPRDKLVLKDDIGRAYHDEFNLVGYGVAMSAAWLVCRMTAALDVQAGEKVLEIGTGSGYHSALLANLTDKLWSIEIIKPLAERTRNTYDELIARGYTELNAITTKHADGYYGWEEAAPFDKIVVTCGVDHVPPSLLSQLRPNGVMVIPVGPIGAHRVLKIAKQQAADGTIRIARSNVYSNHIIPFAPFTKLEGGAIKGTHSGRS